MDRYNYKPNKICFVVGYKLSLKTQKERNKESKLPIILHTDLFLLPLYSTWENDQNYCKSLMYKYFPEESSDQMYRLVCIVY